LGHAIRRARGSRTQAELAAALHVPQPSICKWEQGKPDLHYEQVHGLEVELGVPLGTLGLSSGYVSVHALILSPTPVTEFETDFMPEALGAVEAAARLGFPIRLMAEPMAVDRQGAGSYRWVVTILPKQ